MLNYLWIKFSFFLSLIIFMILPTLAFADDNYTSTFINQSDQNKVKYTLVKTRLWPETGCIVDSGPDILKPGDSTKLSILKIKGCEEAGIGYSLYKTDDTKKEHLLGYVSHRFRDGGFSLQVSIFCQGEQCIFRDLNPEQMR